MNVMKHKTISFFLSVPLLLTSCMKSNHAIILPFNGEEKANLIETNAEKIVSMIKNNYSFMLYQYSTGCSSCNECSKNFESFLEKNPYTIYKYNVYMSSDYAILHEYDEKAFPELIITPRVIIIKDGRVIDEINTSKLTQSRLFNGAIKAFSKENKHLFMSFTLDGYQALLNKKENIKTVLIDTISNKNLDIYFAKYQDFKLNEDYVFIDETYASNELIESIEQPLQ